MVRSQKENDPSPPALWVRVSYWSYAHLRDGEALARVVWTNRSFVELHLPDEIGGERVLFRRKDGIAARVNSRWIVQIVTEELPKLPPGTSRKREPKLTAVEFLEPYPKVVVTYKRSEEKAFSQSRWEVLRLERGIIVTRPPTAIAVREVRFSAFDGSDLEFTFRKDGWYFSLISSDEKSLAFRQSDLAEFYKRWDADGEALDENTLRVRFQKVVEAGRALEGETTAFLVKRSKTQLTLKLPDKAGGGVARFSLKTGLELAKKKSSADLVRAVKISG